MDVFSSLMVHARPHFFQEALRAAYQLGLFAALEEPQAPARLAASLDLSLARLRPLLDVLVLEGALQRAPAGCLSRAEPPPPPPPGPVAGWGRLAEVLRRDRPLDPAEGFAGAEEAGARFQRHLREAGGAAADEVAQRLAPAFAAGGVLLDAGGGVGTYAAALLQRAPAARAVLVERPAVLALAREEMAALGALERIELREGDLFTDDLGQGHQIVLLCNVLHLYNEVRCAALVERAARSLRCGGEVVVKDLRVTPERSGSAAGLYFALNMALYTQGGDVHDTDVLRGLLLRAGLREVKEERLRSSPDAVLMRGQAPCAP